ncbi:hypothetical protein [Oleiharenicola lentus]|uniref:hypothetical protein n=1 Tax=Oleiharenicola lentus TaxID=2508720 RepID=UPI003F662154
MNRIKTIGLVLLVTGLMTGVGRAERSPQETYATELIERHRETGKLDYRIDNTLGSSEAFHLERAANGKTTHVVAGGPGGVLYGVQEALAMHSVVGAEGAPDFELRGAVLMMLSASWNYQSDLSPEIYPWFFDRPLMVRYLDYLLSARLNTLVLWSGHLFPHILDLPEYPDASQFTKADIHRNQEQFRWLAQECAKRNITILTHFYNIHISEHQAKALGREGKEAARYTEADEWVRGYYRTILTRYFEEFPNVGLYICPGESLAQAEQLPWFRDVVFKAAQESGRNPRLVIRDWTMANDFKAALPSLYENLYSELKHNDETITSPWPDKRHATWKGFLKGHIINLHDPADAVPYRVGGPKLIGEMIGHWKDAGYFKGAWFYPPQAWCWPYTLDLDAEGKDAKLLAFERDELWHLLEGRYLWKATRDAAEEQAWAAAWLGRKFGDAQIGRALTEWYDLADPILPGLQNLTATRFGNFFPTSIGWVQAQVDDILSYRTKIDDAPLAGPTGLTKQRYYSQPIDAYTAELYRKKYSGSGGNADLRSLPVAQFAEMRARGESAEAFIRPDALIDLYLEMAQTSLAKAKIAHARGAGGAHAAELQRFVQDSQALVYTVEFYRLKVRAALEKRLFELTKKPEHAAAFRAHMEASLPAYERMFTYAAKYYRAGSSMWDAKPWSRAFEEKVKLDYTTQLKWLEEQGGLK